MTIPAEYVSVDRTGGVGTLTLMRTAAFNAFDAALALEFRTRLRFLGTDPETRVIVITGSGAAFSVGQDVFDMAKEEAELGPDAVGEQLRTRFLPIMMEIRTIEKPVIASVNGVATGAGLAIALACDFRIASEMATFVMVPLGIGLIPGSGITALLPKMIGLAKTTELFMLGERIDASQAHELGLLYAVVAAAELNSATAALATKLVGQPAPALGLIKRAINRAMLGNFEEHLQYEAMLQVIAADSPEHRERLAALVNREDLTSRD